MKRITLFGMIVVCALFTACSNQKSQDNAAAQENAVGILENLEQQDVNNMVNVINTISAVVDSIQLQENMIFSMEESAPKIQVVEKLKAFKRVLAEKQAMIDQLTVENGANKKALANLQKMVDFMKGELEAKSRQIAQLEELVDKKNMSIAELRSSLFAAESESAELKDQNQQQDKQLNEVYYIIGTKSELKEKGMLKGGFLSKKRTDYANLNKNEFVKKDKRALTTLTIDSKKPKLITEKPESSYTLTTNDDGTSTLKIVDVKAFWDASPFLIIQQ